MKSILLGVLNIICALALMSASATLLLGIIDFGEANDIDYLRLVLLLVAGILALIGGINSLKEWYPLWGQVTSLDVVSFFIYTKESSFRRLHL